MSWSNKNLTWHRLQQARADATREEEVAIARAIQAAEPGSWGEALRRATLILSAN